LRDDLYVLFSLVEATSEFTYALMENFDSADPRPSYTTARELPSLGQATSYASIGSSAYLVVRRAQRVNPEIIGARVVIDQLANPHSIRLILGGLFSPLILLEGVVDTCSSTPESRSIHAEWRKAMLEVWTKRGPHLLGAGALAMLRDGGRLLQDSRSTPEYDLPRES
jgi:hypothetical protein